MKVIKFLFLSLFSFAVISCSNIYNQGDASLEICLPGSPDYDARFIDIPDPGAFGQNLMGAFFQIILDGPVHAEQIIEYGNPCVFDNLKSGRYKLSIYTWSQDPVSGSQWNQLYCYGEKNIAVFSGKNTRAMDVYALSINNIKEITGASSTIQLWYGGNDEQLPDIMSQWSGEEDFILGPYLENCIVWYKGGYKEDYQPIRNQINMSDDNLASWVIYKDGNVVCKNSDFGENVQERYIDFYPNQNGYEIVYTYTINTINGDKKIQLKSSVDFTGRE